MDNTKERKEHWERIYETRDVTKVFWYQTSPSKSIELIKKYSKPDSSIIDMGCGTSFLADKLLDEKYKRISLLDTSEASLNIVKNRISNQNINFICADILDFQSEQKFDIWHDRAVFHFLLNKTDREKYFQILSDTLKNNGTCIMSTFKVDGDISCAGLDVIQYNSQKIQNELPTNLELIEYQDYIHITPKSTEQKYIYFVIKKVTA